MITEKEALIKDILAIEEEMFANVQSLEPSPCQGQRDTFRLMRWMTHSVLPEKVLSSYLDDLQLAMVEGRNLMTEKYARMADQIPPLQEDVSCIERIAEIEGRWMDAMRVTYPSLFQGSGESFRTYISGELETYSPKTLALMETAVTDADARGRNLVLERYTNMFGRLGYAALEDYEAAKR